MLDILLSNSFMLGVICTVLFFLVLVTIIPSTRETERLPQQKQWRVIDPPELLSGVTTRRISKANQIESKG